MKKNVACLPGYDNDMPRDYKTYCNFQYNHVCVEIRAFIVRVKQTSLISAGQSYLSPLVITVLRKSFDFSLNMWEKTYLNFICKKTNIIQLTKDIHLN